MRRTIVSTAFSPSSRQQATPGCRDVQLDTDSAVPGPPVASVWEGSFSWDVGEQRQASRQTKQRMELGAKVKTNSYKTTDILCCWSLKKKEVKHTRI